MSAILDRLGALGAVLGSSWGRLGAVLGPSWAILGHLGAILGPSWAILGPSWAVLGLLGQLGTQDRPKRAQESPKTILSSFWGHFGDHLGAPNWDFSGSFLGSFFGPVFGDFLD